MRPRTSVALGLACVIAAACQSSTPQTARLPSSVRPPPSNDAVVTGAIQGPDGSSVSGALVALNSIKGNRLASGRTDGQGLFRLPRPRERFGITATSPGATALFVPPAGPGQPARAPQAVLRLGRAEDGMRIDGTVTLADGTTAGGLLVAASRISPEEGDIFHAEVAPSGAFALQVPPGRYTLKVEPPDPPGAAGQDLLSTVVRVAGEAGSRARVELTSSRRAPAPDAVVEWLRARAMPVATSTPGSPTDDLAPLAAALGTARVIGVGEATHGTREIFRIKHRLLEHLVARHGVTTFAMEANFADAEHVDAYLQTGRGTVDQALARLFRVWRTEEIRDLLLWMRTWNADPRHRRKIHFRGYDVQTARPSIEALRTFLRRVVPAAEAMLLGGLAPLDRKTNNRGMIELSEAEASQTREAIARLRGWLKDRRAAHVSRSSAAVQALAAQHARLLEQAHRRFVARSRAEQFIARDAAMAENVMWLLQQEPGARMMVWAHNGHVQLDASWLPGTNMGIRLRQQLGRDYVSVGFLLHAGTYRAAPDPKKPAITVDVALATAGPGDVAEAFSRVALPMFAVDLREATGRVLTWLQAPHPLFSCGWVALERERRGYPDALSRLFDVVVYLDRTTSVRPIGR